MAKLVGVFAASHGPMIAREWDTLSPPTRALVEQGFGSTGERLMMTRPDVLIIVSPDHWCNFFLNNFPAFCVGIGEEHDGPPEPFLKTRFNHPVLAGHPGLGRHIMDTALARDFDPSLSHRLTLDHGFCLPLWRMGIDPIPAVADGHRSDPTDRADRRQRGGRSDADDAALSCLGLVVEGGDRKLSG